MPTQQSCYYKIVAVIQMTQQLISSSYHLFILLTRRTTAVALKHRATVKRLPRPTFGDTEILLSDC